MPTAEVKRVSIFFRKIGDGSAGQCFDTDACQYGLGGIVSAGRLASFIPGRTGRQTLLSQLKGLP
jgi:hypothetical protein